MKNIFFLASLLIIVSCSQKDSLVEETQAQINERLDKEQAEKLIIGSWKLHFVIPVHIWFADSVRLKRTLTVKTNGLATLESKNEKGENIASDLKYVYVRTGKEGLPRYVFSISDMHDSLILYKASTDTLYDSSSRVESQLLYVRTK